VTIYRAAQCNKIEGDISYLNTDFCIYRKAKFVNLQPVLQSWDHSRVNDVI